MSARLEQLREMLADDPSDPFTRYALGMELKGLGRAEEALAELSRLLDEAPGYVPTWYQCGKLLHELGRTERALEVLRRGVEVAQAAGDAHTTGELEDLLRLVEEAA